MRPDHTHPCSPLARRLGAATLLAALALPTGSHAGEVAVVFTQAQRYTDIGFAPATRERNLSTLQEHLSRWGQRLPKDARLELEFLDVDLAGVERPVGREPFVRVIDGRVDGPRMTLRWTLWKARPSPLQGRSSSATWASFTAWCLGTATAPWSTTCACWTTGFAASHSSACAKAFGRVGLDEAACIVGAGL